MNEWSVICPDCEVKMFEVKEFQNKKTGLSDIVRCPKCETSYYFDDEFCSWEIYIEHSPQIKETCYEHYC